MAAQLITLSRLLTEALERQEFEQLCFDTFRPVYDQFSDGMTRGARTRLLLDYVGRQRLTAALLREVRSRNASRYGEFVDALAAALLTQLTASPAGLDSHLGSALQILVRGQPRLRLALEDLTQAPGDADLQLILRTQVRRQALTDETLAAGLYELLASGQSAVDDIAPPPRPLAPPAVGDFVGRADDLAYFGDILRTKHFAVISGMAGVGKTVLAARLARDFAGVESRIFWYDFHEPLDVDAIIVQLAGFLYYQERPSLWEMLESARQRGTRTPQTDVLFNYVFQELRGLGCLLCLDDFHLVDESSPLIETFVEHLATMVYAGDVSLILVARRIPGFVQTVQFRALDGLSAVDAGVLLAQRGINLPPELLAALHAQVQGNGQLLNLAADLLRHSREPATLIATLSEQQDVERFLVRQIDESSSDDERTVLRAVSALLGYPATLAALSAVLNRSGVRRIIQSLTDRHLLSSHEAAEGRVVSLHAILRSYYYADLSPDDRKTLHHRAGAFYETQQPDPLLAVEHFLRAGEIEHAGELATTDVWAFINRGQARALPRLLAQFADHPLPDLLRARLELTAGEIQQFDGASEAAQASYRQVLDLAERLPLTPARRSLIVRVCQRLGDMLSDQAPDEAKIWLRRGLEEVGADSGLERADLLVTLSTVQIAAGDWTAGRESALAALQTAPALPDQLWMRAQFNLGIVASELGDLDGAIGHTSQAAARARQTHDDFWRLIAEMNLGVYIFTQGDWEGAIQRLTEANELAGRVGSGTQRAQLAVNLGYLLLRRGDDAEAGAQLQAAVNLARQHHLVRHEIAGLLNLAEWEQRRAELDAALALVADAERLALATRIQGHLPEIYRRRGQIKLAAGDAAGALNAIAQSLAEAADTPLEHGISLRVQGRALAASGEPQAAGEAFARSLEQLAGVDPYEAARTRLAWARLRLASGDEQGAQVLFDVAAEVFARLGAQRDLEETLQARSQS
jgi:tetratricopeptide (TPR) repeat protein